MNQEYKVGYGKAPKSGQFQKGKSGNPKGRPIEKAKTFLDLLQSELKSVVELPDGNKISKEAALARQLTNSAIRGDHTSQRLLLKLQEKNCRIKKSEEFFNKLIKEHYLTESSIDEFLYENKKISLNKADVWIWFELAFMQIAKESKAEAAITIMTIVDSFSKLLRATLNRIAICEEIIAEYDYWSTTDKVLDLLDISERKRNSIYKKMSKERTLPRPPEVIYEQAKAEYMSEQWGLLYATRRHMDFLRKVPGYEEAEKELLTKKYLDIAKENLPKEDFLKYKETKEWQAERYQRIDWYPTSKKCQEERDARLYKGEIILYEWYRENSGKLDSRTFKW